MRQLRGLSDTGNDENVLGRLAGLYQRFLKGIQYAEIPAARAPGDLIVAFKILYVHIVKYSRILFLGYDTHSIISNYQAPIPNKLANNQLPINRRKDAKRKQQGFNWILVIDH